MSEANTPPDQDLNRPDEELIESIREIKREQGDALTILGHHYQRAPIVRLSDFVGDSFKLCQDAAGAAAKYIVFCGVRFMAESARVVARDDQIVQHPVVEAGCPMADMADIRQVEKAWAALTELQGSRRIIPVTYMNSDVELKAFCGRNGGVVCTSSNASKLFDWAYERGDTIFFFPDEHLGMNTALDRGMNRGMLVWDPARADELAEDRRFADAQLVVWKGYCHVHTHFTRRHIEKAREKYPDAHIIVHPECPREVVAASDASGSTAAIVRRVREAKPGETIVIGTEDHLVSRLVEDYPHLTIAPLAVSVCPNMGKIRLEHLLHTLRNPGTYNVVEVEPAIAADARLALERMLALA